MRAMLSNVTEVFAQLPSGSMPEVQVRLDGNEWTSEPLNNDAQVEGWEDHKGCMIEVYAPEIQENLKATVLGTTPDGRVRLHVDGAEDAGEK